MDACGLNGLLNSWNGSCGVAADLERQLDGTANAKAPGAYRGRKPSVPVDDVRRLHEAGTRPSDIAKQLGIGRASVYRTLDKKLPVGMIL